MPLIEFTPNLARQTNATTCLVEGCTVAEALEQVFAERPALRGYLLDDQGSVRTHVVIFVDGTAIKDRRYLTDLLRSESEVFVMQALSGG